MRIAVSTACTPWLPLPDLVPRVSAAGYQGIEIGLTDRRWEADEPPDFWNNNGATLDWASAEDAAEHLKQLLDQHGLTCCAVASTVHTDDIDRAALAAQVAHTLGSEFIRVRAPWYREGASYQVLLDEARTAYRDLAMISMETGIDSLLELHDCSICPSASAAMRVLEGLDPTHVGVIFDPGNFVAEGYESIPMAIDLLGPYLRHVHVKDRCIEVRSEPDRGAFWLGRDVPLGQGHIDWPHIVRLLHERGYDGWWSIESFADLERGPDRMAADLAWLRELGTAVESGT